MEIITVTKFRIAIYFKRRMYLWMLWNEPDLNLKKKSKKKYTKIKFSIIEKYEVS